MALTLAKLRRKLRQRLTRTLRRSAVYPLLYRSSWHGKIVRAAADAVPSGSYLTAIPNPDAGIGHQMANWIAGYWYARVFGLRFAHSPFSSSAWEALLGFGAGEAQAGALVAGGMRRVRLPMFDEDDAAEVARVRRIIRSYAGKPTLFVAEWDQFYRDQIGVIDDIAAKFRAAQARDPLALRYAPDRLDIAVHVRRGDIAAGQGKGADNANLAMRWQTNTYFVTALECVLAALPAGIPFAIWLFSQGDRAEFAEFEQFSNLTFCFDMGARESFVHMARADVLITSRSSFSYKPALLGDGVVICPPGFWHGYPDRETWIRADRDGHFDVDEFGEVLAKNRPNLFSGR